LSGGLQGREVSITRAGRAMIADARKYWRRAQRALEDEVWTRRQRCAPCWAASPPRNFRSP